MRIATWNVNSLKARQDRVDEWLAYAKPDVVCLQETKLADKNFPHLQFQALGYDSVHHGYNQWNGVAIPSRVGIENVSHGFGDGAVDPYEGDARVDCRDLAVCVSSACTCRTAARRRASTTTASSTGSVACTTGSTPRRSPPTTSPCSATSTSLPTTATCGHPRRSRAPLRDRPRARRRRPTDAAGLVDVFREHYADDGLFSDWHYRGGYFHQHRGMRIDLVLASVPLAAVVVGACRPQCPQGQATVGSRPRDRRLRLTPHRQEPSVPDSWND